MAAADGDAQRNLDQLRDWLNAQPHLPKDIEDRYLRRFLHSCYNDLEKTKSAVELFFTLRASSPELLNNRDPLAEHTKKAMKICNLANLRITGNKNLWIWQLNDPGLDNYDYVQDAKLFFLSSDAWLMEDDHLEDEDIVIMDVKDISLKFITKFNVQCAKKLSKYQEEAMPIRLKQIHIVNSPSAIDKIYALMKPFLKQEITNMVKFHTPKSETLFNYISREDLPEDYGGTRGTMVEHMKDVSDLIIRQRENLINESLWKAIDKKKKTKGEKPVETSSFRSLAID